MAISINRKVEQRSDKDRMTPGTSTVLVKIPFTTFLTGIALIVVCFVTYRIWPLLELIILAALLAIALRSAVDSIERKGISAGWSETLVITVFLFCIVMIFYIAVPSLFEQAGILTQKYPLIRNRVLQYLPEGSSFRNYILHYGEPAGTAITQWYDNINWAGGRAISSLGQFAVSIVIAIYLVVDGPRLYDWFLVFFRNETQEKFERTADEGSELIFAYVVGQAITSGLVIIFTLSLLTIFQVPGAGMLSLLAGIFDIFPVIGFFLSAGPAVLLALTLSPFTALIVGLGYLGYHLLENYYIVPKVYGKKLRLSTTAVLLSLLIGWELAGVPGALLALPIAASYSVIEKIWLSSYLHRRVIREHEEQKKKEFGDKNESIA